MISGFLLSHFSFIMRIELKFSWYPPDPHRGLATNNNLFSKFSKSGKFLSILVFVLLGIGLMMIMSAGVVEGQKKFDDAY